MTYRSAAPAATLPNVRAFSLAIAVLGSTPLAQTSATDRASRNITLVIVGLLLIALALALLTAWYWRKTDPRRRLAAAKTRRVPSPANGGGSDPMVVAGAAASAAPRPQASVTPTGDDHDASFWAPSPGSEPTASAHHSSGNAEQPPAATGPMTEDDEWLSLTGPQSLPRPEQSGSDHR